MNETQLLDYMRQNNCIAKVGKPDTLEAACALEKRGMIKRVGEWDETNPGIIFHLTDKALNLYGFRPSPLTQFRDAISGSQKEPLTVPQIEQKPMIR